MVGCAEGGISYVHQSGGDGHHQTYDEHVEAVMQDAQALVSTAVARTSLLFASLFTGHVKSLRNTCAIILAI
jgi:succinate dehydrogenase/fumarate reductase flavoprotein subunit